MYVCIHVYICICIYFLIFFKDVCAPGSVTENVMTLSTVAKSSFSLFTPKDRGP